MSFTAFFSAIAEAHRYDCMGEMEFLTYSRMGFFPGYSSHGLIFRLT